ncbi:hypothetical protein IWW42_005684 [Coemansia sp. RSA 1085]|nr:hypothetical protein IWW42_005684 [Coemansia sp. RSA 1085]
MVVHGENMVSAVEMSRSSKKGYTFVYNSDKYCWLPSGSYGIMNLYDPNESIAAYDQSETVKCRNGQNYIDSTTEEMIQRHISCSRLYLPSLRSLILVNNYKYCPILSTAVLPQQMDIFSVSVSPQTIMMLAKSAIPQVQQFSVRLYSCTDVERSSTVVALNYMFHQTSIDTNAMLTFDSPTRSIMPSEIDGANISYLSVRRKVTLKMLMGFMSNLPALSRLETHLDQSDESELELAVPDSVEHPLPPFTARVNYFRLDYDSSTDSIVPFIKYILLRLPHIKTLSSYMTFSKPILEFVEEYKSRYPHLTIVDFILNPVNLWHI